MRQSHHLAAVELHFDDLVCIRFPRGRLEVGIARSVGFDEGPAAAVRGGDVNRQAPVEGEQARLAPIRQPDFDNAIVADGGRIIGICPDQHLVAV